jgi:adenosylcobinamide-phosphate synthase
MMFEPTALAALVLDAAIGWPAALYRRIGHPVGLFAQVIETCERGWNRREQPAAASRLLGVVAILLVVALASGGAWLLQSALAHALGRWGWLGCAILAFPALAQRSLHDHVRPVQLALGDGDLAGARRAVGLIVGRDTADLDAAGISRAAIESLAESFCDGVAAPLFWLLLLGLPGVWGYKAINTADSLIGHREERWRAFGWAAARLDDVANWIPARLGGALICFAAERRIGPAAAIMLRDAGNHASPNAGWTEAAMAGALDLRLAGPVSYDGVLSAKPWIGAGRSEATEADIGHALAVYRRACLLLWVAAAGLIAGWR